MAEIQLFNVVSCKADLGILWLINLLHYEVPAITMYFLRYNAYLVTESEVGGIFNISMIETQILNTMKQYCNSSF